MFKSIKKYLVLLILIITAALTSVGYSAFVLSERVSNEATQSAITDSSPVVSIKYETIKTTKTVGPETIEVNYTGTDATNYNTYYNKYKKQYGSIDVGGLFSTSATYNYLNPPEELAPIVSEKVDDGNGNLTWTETTYYIYLLSTKTGKATFGSSKTFYGVKISYIITTYTYGSSIEMDSSGNQIVFNRYTLKNGEKLSKPTLYRNGYAFVDFYKSNSNGTAASDELFDFNTPITSNTTIFAKWTELKDDNGGTISSTKFADYINGVSGTGNVYNGSSGYDISSDPTYSLDSKKVSLTSANVKSGATVNLCMNNGSTNINATEQEEIGEDEVPNSTNKDDEYVSLDYGTGNTRDYTVVLNGDLNINGTLNLGGWTGSKGSDGPQGYIIRNYVVIDLNGHNININSGGKFFSYGLIMDSKGTGCLNVKAGGILYTQFVTWDSNGGNNTLWSYAKNICPFNNYSLPYLKCNLSLEVTTSSSGFIYGFTKINLGSLGFTNLHIPIVGRSDVLTQKNENGNNESVKFFINAYGVKSGNAGYINYKYKEVEQLKSTTNHLNVFRQCFYVRNVFEANNLLINFDYSRIIGVMNIAGYLTKAFVIEVDRVNFPVSSAFNIYFNDCIVTLAQEIVLQPGSIMEFDKDTILIMDYYDGDNSQLLTPAEKTYPDVAIKFNILIVNIDATMPGTKKYISGELTALSSPPSANNPATAPIGLYSSKYSSYWTYFKKATVNIFGRIHFNEGNHNPYALSGNININEFSYGSDYSKSTVYRWNKNNITNIDSINNINTYNFNFNSSANVWFTSTDGIKSGGARESLTSMNQFYCEPLTSNGVSYLVNSSYCMYGSYNNNTGIFEDQYNSYSGSKTPYYFFKTSKHLLKDWTDSNYPQSAGTTVSKYDDLTLKEIDTTITPTNIVSYSSSNFEYVYDGTNYYIYYGGNMFVTDSAPTTTSATLDIVKFSTNIQKSTYYANYINRTMTYSSGKWKL